MNNPILSVQNLITELKINRIPYKVIDDLSFDLYPGKTVALVGESGCGKSMTALSIMRILPHPPALPSRGKILYRGTNLLELSEKKMRSIRGARIAMIFQDPTSCLNPVYTIGEQLLEVVELHLKLYREEALTLVIKALQEVGIPQPEERLYDYPHQLSGGMRQRIMIAMALICEPDILIADEPTTALDVTIQAQVLDLIRALQKKRKMALLLITHDMGVVAEMADEVIVMYASQQVEKGDVFSIFDHMSHPYTVGLFNSRPSLQGATREKLHAIKGSVPPLGKYPQGCKFHPRCSFCMSKCKEIQIPDFQVAGGENHTAKCLLWDGTEESNLILNSDFKKEIPS